MFHPIPAELQIVLGLLCWFGFVAHLRVVLGKEKNQQNIHTSVAFANATYVAGLLAIAWQSWFQQPIHVMLWSCLLAGAFVAANTSWRHFHHLQG